MDLLPAARFAAEPGDRVHREARVGRVVLAGVFSLIGAVLLCVPLIAGPWGLLAWLLGLPVSGCAALVWPGALRGFRSDPWAVRLRPGGIALRVRSYMNDDLPSDEPTVCWLGASEIRSLRPVRTERLLPGGEAPVKVVEQHLDIRLTHSDTHALAAALAREQDAPRRGRTHHHVYPVRLPAPDPWPRFRALVKEHATASSLTIVTPAEPGQRLRVRMRLVEADGSPSAGARVYLYHTDARGDYGPNDAGVPLTGSDNEYARLFGYAVTDSSGTIEVRTIRPGGYPDSTVPVHIHLRIRCRDARSFGAELWFDDDPRVDRAAREEAARDRISICPVTLDALGQASVEARIELD